MGKIEGLDLDTYYVDSEFIDHLDGCEGGAYVITGKEMAELIQLVREECKPKWIPVSEMTPPHCSDCLVFIDNGKVKYSGVYIFIPEVWDQLGVTHWQPLPEAPTSLTAEQMKPAK